MVLVAFWRFSTSLSIESARPRGFIFFCAPGFCVSDLKRQSTIHIPLYNSIFGSFPWLVFRLYLIVSHRLCFRVKYSPVPGCPSASYVLHAQQAT